MERDERDMVEGPKAGGTGDGPLGRREFLTKFAALSAATVLLGVTTGCEPAAVYGPAPMPVYGPAPTSTPEPTASPTPAPPPSPAPSPTEGPKAVYGPPPASE